MRIVRVLAASLCLVGLAAVPALADGPEGGIQGGISFSRMSPALTGESVSISPGLQVGVYGLFPFIKIASIQTEFVYAQKYHQITTRTGSTSQISDVKFDYLEIPILAKMKLFKSIYMLEGVSIAFPVRARIERPGAEQDVKSRTTSPDVGIVIGGGGPVQKNFAIEGRYDGGVRRVDKTVGAAIKRNRSFSILARIKL